MLSVIYGPVVALSAQTYQYASAITPQYLQDAYHGLIATALSVAPYFM